MRRIKVLLVDDSRFTRYKLSKVLETYPDIQIVGEAYDGSDALVKIPILRPDVVTMDVEMRKLDGLTALERIMTECPTPVVMVSSLTQKSAQITIRALMLGAVDFVAKPSNITSIQEVTEELVAKIRAAAHISPGSTPVPLPEAMETAPAATVLSKRDPQPFRTGDPVVVVGASAGGPRALNRILPQLPGDFPGAVIVVQHMPMSITGAMTQRLNDVCALPVQEAVSGQSLARGQILVARGGYHLRFEGTKRVALDDSEKRNGVRPAVDVSMESAAQQHGRAAIGIVLTGMGHDGTSGAHHIKAAGGRIIAQDESTSLIYGMPRSVIEAGYADYVAPLDEIVPTLLEMIAWKTKNTRS